MINETSEMKIDSFKPNMKFLKSIQEIQLTPQTVIQLKVDGEFNLLVYDRNGETFTLNKWNRKRRDFPALNELINALNQTPIQKAEFLCELYAKTGDKPLKLPDFIRHVKSDNPEDHLKVHIGIWDWIKTDGHEVNQPYIWKYQELQEIFKNCTHVSVLPFFQPNNHAEIQTLWQIYIEKLGYEGLVIRNNHEIFKLKPHGEVDAVIIGLNKESGYGKRTLFDQKQVPSIKLAVMDEQGNFIELSDCGSGLNEELRKALWKLMDYKVDEDHETVYVKPIVVCQIEYMETFSKERRVLKFDGQKYMQVGTKQYVTLRHPRLIRFRPDKTANPTDIRANQIPNEAKPLSFTLYQGDCRKILPMLKDESIDLIITSPPYYKVKEYGGIEGEIGVKGNVEQYQKDLLAVLKECYRLLTPQGVLCLNLDKGGEFSVWDFIPQIKSIGFQLIDTIIWYDKTRRREAGYPHLSHSFEPIFILTKTKQFTMNKASLHQNDVWEISHYKGVSAEKGDAWDRMTIATFPVKLVEQLMDLYSNPNDTVLDPFCGSGTVLDVAQRMERNAIGIEINPEFCEIIMQRVFDKNPNHKYEHIKI